MAERSGKRKKRSAKTSPDQYSEYMRLMEADSVFRTGSINPTIDPDYVNKKWESLAQKLNSSGYGPELTVTEWKKRFTDWKNATRAKYRKIVEHSKGTGGGPPIDIKITPLEDRALTVWGRVAVTGTPRVLIVGGLQDCNVEKEEQDTPEEKKLEIMQETSGWWDGSESNENTESIADYTVRLAETLPKSMVEVVDVTSIPSTSTSTGTRQRAPKMSLFDKITTNKQRKITGHRPLPVISEELLAAYKKTVDTENINVALEEKKIELEFNKFRFEVAKYKFENPGFEFEIEKFRN